MTDCASPSANSFSPSTLSSSSPASSLCTASTLTTTAGTPAAAGAQSRLHVLQKQKRRRHSESGCPQSQPLITPTSKTKTNHHHSGRHTVLAPAPLEEVMTNHPFPPSPPTSSQGILSALQDESGTNTLDFPINEECTCLTLHPDGRFVLGGFSDGTLRIFDLEAAAPGGSVGKAAAGTQEEENSAMEDDDSRRHRRSPLGDEDEDDDEEEEHEAILDDDDLMTGPPVSTGTPCRTMDPSNGSSSNISSPCDQTTHSLSSSTTTGTKGNSFPYHKKARTRLVSSKQFQTFGAVACQIVAKGVHTDLLMHVEASQDGQYCFAGVQRGSMELHAVYLGHLLKHHYPNPMTMTTKELESSPLPSRNVLDFLRVHVHSDAKLKGFGACTRVIPKTDGTALSRPKYLLLTGKGIKNIHIWSFEPPVYDTTSSKHGGGLGEGIELEPARWQQLYDTQTNGNTISLLRFAYTPHAQNTLWAISKSDRQKLRLWDLSQEQTSQKLQGSSTKQGLSTTALSKRPKRPPYKDVCNTEAGLAIAGHDFCICGGNGMYNQMSIVCLDHPESMYNHTELELPVVGASGESSSDSVRPPSPSRSSRRRRPQRGDLKQVVRVASMANDASHVVLELDDRSLVHYTTQLSSNGKESGHKQNQFPRLQRIPESIGIPELPGDFYSRTMCLAKLYDQAIVAAVSIYNPNTGRGSIAVRALEWINKNTNNNKMSPPSNVENAQSPQTTDQRAIQECVEAPPTSALVVRKRKRSTTPKLGNNTGKMDIASSAHKKSSSSSEGMVPPSSVVSVPSTKSRPQMGRGVQLFTGADSSSSLLITPQHQSTGKDAQAALPRMVSTVPTSSKTNKSPGAMHGLAQTVSPDRGSVAPTATTIAPQSMQDSKTEGSISKFFPRRPSLTTSTKPTTSSKAVAADKGRLASKDGQQGLVSNKESNGTSTSMVNGVSSVAAPLLKQKSKDLLKKASDIRGVIKMGHKQPLSVSSASKEERPPTKKLKVTKECLEMDATPKVESVVSLSVPRKKKKRKNTDDDSRRTTAPSAETPQPRASKGDSNLERSLVPPSDLKKINKMENQSSVSKVVNPRLSSESEPNAAKTAKPQQCDAPVMPSRHPIPARKDPISTNTIPQKTKLDKPTRVSTVEQGNANDQEKLVGNKESTPPTAKRTTSQTREDAPSQSTNRMDLTPPRTVDESGLKCDTKLGEKIKRRKDLASLTPTTRKNIVKAKEVTMNNSNNREDENVDPLLGIANVLCLLKTPPGSKTKKRGTVSDTPAMDDKKLPEPKFAKTSPSKTPDDVIVGHHKELKALLAGLSSSRRKLFQSNRSLVTCGGSGNILERRQQVARSRLEAEHRAAHELVQKRLLQAAVGTVGSLLDSVLSAEVAKAQLNDSIKSYHHALFDTIRRQELEATTLAAEQTCQRQGMPVEPITVLFPFAATFAKVHQIAESISVKRGPGRPPNNSPRA